MTWSSALDWLLGLERMSTEDVRAHLGWARPMSMTVWVMVVLGAIVLAGWSYHQLGGRRFWRISMALLRALLLLVLAVMIATPQMVIQQERVEPDRVFMLVDRSASMQIRDMAGSTLNIQRDALEVGDASGGKAQVAMGGRVSRDAVLREALRVHGDAFSAVRVGEERRVVWLGFDEGVYGIGSPVDGELPDAVGRGTHLRTAIDEALQRGVGRPISAVVLMTDGRSAQATDEELVNRLDQLAARVIVVPMGAARVPMDLGIGRVDAPDKAFVNEPVPVRVWVDRSSGGGDSGKGGDDMGSEDTTNDSGKNGAVLVRLIDPATQTVMDEQTLAGDVPADEPARLMGRWSIAGPTTWRVEVSSVAGTGEAEGELITDNNTLDVVIEFVDRPMRVLLVEGYPRWEYRYLKNMLVRNDAIQTSVLLTNADASFAQEGDLPITRLPREAEELAPYDVVIVGDVNASQFSADQMAMLRDHVSIRGAGLLWIGGPHSTPTSYDGTPLADLLPMRSPSRTDSLDMGLGPFVVEPTSLAAGLSVLELIDPRETNVNQRHYTRAGVRWPIGLPGLQWVQDVGLIKPTAEVLAVAMLGGADGQVPSVLRLRYGAGQSVYVATDETWRWRYGRGELYFEQFWMQLVQMLGRGRLEQRNDAIGLSVSHRRIQVGQPMVVNLRVEDGPTLERQLASVAVEVVRGRGEDDGLQNGYDAEINGEDPQNNQEKDDENAGENLKRIAGGNVVRNVGANVGGDVGGNVGGERFELLPKGDVQGGRRDYEAIWTPRVDGALMLRVVEPTLVDWGLRQPVEVIRPDDELRQIAADHERLIRLANQTGGAVVPIAELGRVLEHAPNRAKRTPVDQTETIWDSPLALIVVMSLLTLEWVGRKTMRLV